MLIIFLCFQFSGVNAARDAGLTFMVGGSENCFKSAEKFLSIMGKNVVHCGPVGTGQVVY
jgi:3-hydroxyisobutyrate dehydrogenase